MPAGRSCPSAASAAHSLVWAVPLDPVVGSPIQVEDDEEADQVEGDLDEPALPVNDDDCVDDIDDNEEDIDHLDALPVVRIVGVLFIECQQTDLALLQRLGELALDDVGHGEDGHKLGKKFFVFVCWMRHKTWFWSVSFFRSARASWNTSVR